MRHEFSVHEPLGPLPSHAIEVLWLSANEEPSVAHKMHLGEECFPWAAHFEERMLAGKLSCI